VIAEDTFDLIETMAEEIAKACIGFDRVMRATVVVHKPRAADRLGIAGTAAAVTLPEG
jgi:dihydroneopterin aldolase